MVSAKVGNFVALRRLMISGVAEYSELTSGHAARGHSCSESVISYLKGGQLLVVSPGVVDDLLNPSRIAGTGSVFTDGVWVWDDLLLYYVKNYGFELPQEFIRHAEATGQPPVLSRQELRKVRF